MIKINYSVLMRWLYVILLFMLSGCAYQPISVNATPAKAAIASAHPLATAAGLDILDKSGNAFDAAVAVAAVLGVVEPYSAGLGGGGFWLLHREADNYQVMIDARERAPSRAHADMYLDDQGNFQRTTAINGPLAAGIPGQAAAFSHIVERYGNLPLSESLAHAIRIAHEGFPVNSIYQRLATIRQQQLHNSVAARNIFLINDEVPAINQRIYQHDLAKTLEQLGALGRDGFYKGEIANKLVTGVHQAGGIWQLEDLENYTVIERQPITFHYGDNRIVTVPPPSAGGIALATMFNMLNQYSMDSLTKVQRTHVLVEIMRRAYWDRARYLGDADYVDVPIEQLISQQHADALQQTIDVNQATDSHALTGPKITTNETHTTHFSVLDKAGNRVAATLSINLSFGSGYVPPGTGVLLNNEMDDFAATPGVSNTFGLIGSAANNIEPGKRPLSSMTPTFIETNDKVALIGTPGGSRIITMVLLAILNFIDDTSPEVWVAKPRFHHQYLPDMIQHEADTFTPAEQQALMKLGHDLKEVSPSPSFGNMQVILWDKKNNTVSAASDPRGLGQAIVK